MTTRTRPPTKFSVSPDRSRVRRQRDTSESDPSRQAARRSDPTSWNLKLSPRRHGRGTLATQDSVGRVDEADSSASAVQAVEQALEIAQRTFRSTVGSPASSVQLIGSARTLAELVDAAHKARLDDAADQIENLILRVEHDPDADQLDTDALRHALCFLAEHRSLPDLDISVMEGGSVDLSWSVSPDGVVFVEVGEGGQLAFAMNVPDKSPRRRQRVNGDTSDAEMVACILLRVLSAEEAK